MTTPTLARFALMALLAALVGCDPDPPPPPPAPVAPKALPQNFAGTWNLTTDPSRPPETMTLYSAGGPASNLSMNGRYGRNSVVTGTASATPSGPVFVGTVVWGNTAMAIELRMVTPGQATGTLSRSMRTTDILAVRMGP